MIPTMKFGRTGHESTRVLFGAAALGGVTQSEADKAMELLLNYGVNHIDTAASYGDAELRIGPWMPQFRHEFFLATKTGDRDYQKARESIHRSLERLQTDYIDLIQLHAVIEEDEFEKALGPGGALEAAIEAREQGLVRFIGITSHTLHAPIIHRKALERFDFDSVLLPLNYMLYQIPQYRENFNQLMEICKARNVAVQTIKSICRRPWGEDSQRFAATWYEPLTDPEAIGKAVAYVLNHPSNQVFLNTAGDVDILPTVLEQVSELKPLLSDEEMQQMVEQYQMEPLWSEHEPMH